MVEKLEIQDKRRKKTVNTLKFGRLKTKITIQKEKKKKIDL